MRYEEIAVGSIYSFERVITKQDVADFAALTGDYSPLHIDLEFGKKTPYGKNIVHGMLVASFFSTLVGMYCAGENSVYLSQTVEFKLPLFIGDRVLVEGTVMEKYDSIRTIRLKTQVLVKGKVAVAGEARVKVMAYE